MKYILLLFAYLLVMANSHAQSVTVSQLPSGSICSGTSVEFTANPSGFSGTIYYQWYLNGTAINGDVGRGSVTGAIKHPNIIVSSRTGTVGLTVCV